jgi:hypothetical protein
MLLSADRPCFDFAVVHLRVDRNGDLVRQAGRANDQAAEAGQHRAV